MIPTSFLNLDRRDTDTDRTARRRAAAAVGLFGGPASTHGKLLDFSRPNAPALPTSGTGSVTDFYQPSWKAEQAGLDARAARVDRLPPAVAKLATEQGVTSIELLEIVAVIYRKSAVMGGQPVQCWASDLGKALGMTTQRSEELLQEAVQRGFIEGRSNSYFRSKL